MFKSNSFLGWLFGQQQEAKVKSEKVTKVAAKKVVKKVMPKANLMKLTKDQLEQMGRENGIELDKRKTKDKLVDRLHKRLSKK